MNRLLAFIRLSRLHFLAGGFLMYGLGAAAAPGVDIGPYWVGQAMVTASQITAHYVNEYADLEHDRRVENRTIFSGGSGVLAGGELLPVVALRAAWASTLIALVAAALLVGVNIWAAGLGVASLAVSWAYSMPPARLLGRGTGELAASAVVAGAFPLIGSLAQDASPNSELWWAVAVLVPVHGAMMLAFEVPDLEADTGSGKRVLAVRLGHRVTIVLIAALVGLAVVMALASSSLWVLPAAIPAVALFGALRAQHHAVLTISAVAMFVVAGSGLLVALA